MINFKNTQIDNKVSNLNGNYQETQGPHTNKGNSATLGLPKGDYKKNSEDFTKKQTGMMGRSQIPSSLTGDSIKN